MKLTIIGGGGFRVPQIFQAVSDPAARLRIDELCLFDVDASRIDAIRAVISDLAKTMAHPVRVTSTVDLAESVRGADFVFSAMRVGGIAGRMLDERVALDLGVLGQETIGPGGLAYALRTLPHARDLARMVRDIAPQAWVINFTNPAGLVTEAMREILGDRVTGICDTPIGLMRRATRVAGHRPEEVTFDYVGLNHLGWLRSLTVDGRDVLPEILGDESRLAQIEEARVLGLDWVRALGALPNEYLFYYYRTREAVTRIRGAEQTRGQYLAAKQGEFYGADPNLESWSRTLHDREASYMGESREAGDLHGRNIEDVENGGYQQVALDLMTALTGGPAATMILNVGNDSLDGPRLVPELPENAVVEVPCTVDTDGIHPHRVAAIEGDMLGLMVQVKASEQLVLRASLERSSELAWRAFAGHPLVDSSIVAGQLLEEYQSRIPGVAAALGG
ncbi:6-phospho-beta-glucosidase [Ruania halotolerans]|uniref:6-phospho-beta-glucosidase n=1 Tax=Ruania halotolerans TaxID=2897773 RepID=UPI001E5E7E26|nr:6-phospho-beta-glucosidase [Ruania halotolerans]UFU07975.1 6-phospho-beta-glucosidase [Ruania halotolerans]